MIAPPAAAYLLTKQLSTLLWLSALLGAVSALLGFFVGYFLDIAPTAPIASAAGGLFLLTVFLAPQQGLISRWRHHSHQRHQLFQHLLLQRLEDSNHVQDQGTSPLQLANSATWSRTNSSLRH